MVSELPEHRFPCPSSIKEKEVSYLKNISLLKIAQEFYNIAVDGPTSYYILEKNIVCKVCQVLYLFCPPCVPTTVAPQQYPLCNILINTTARMEWSRRETGLMNVTQVDSNSLRYAEIQPWSPAGRCSDLNHH